MLTMAGRPFQDTTLILGPVSARHHTNLRILSEQICMVLNEIDSAICARDGIRWQAAFQCLGGLLMQLPTANDRVSDTLDMLGEA